MRLTLHEAEWAGVDQSDDSGRRILAYLVGGLPSGENAQIAEYDQSWRILRWNDSWHGNWTGNYSTPEAALEALRAELLAAA
jgi:hypothetical protein